MCLVQSLTNTGGLRSQQGILFHYIKASVLSCTFANIYESFLFHFTELNHLFNSHLLLQWWVALLSKCVPYLLSEGLPKSRHRRWGKGSSRHTAHDDGQAFIARPVGLHWCGLTQSAAGQVGLIASAVDSKVPVSRSPPPGKHPGHMEKKKRRSVMRHGSNNQVIIWCSGYTWPSCIVRLIVLIL